MGMPSPAMGQKQGCDQKDPVLPLYTGQDRVCVGGVFKQHGIPGFPLKPVYCGSPSGVWEHFSVGVTVALPVNSSSVCSSLERMASEPPHSVSCDPGQRINVSKLGYFEICKMERIEKSSVK